MTQYTNPNEPMYRTRHPRVYGDQKQRFENGELFRKLSRESEIRYTGYRDRPLQERQAKFESECREGHADIAFVNTGTNLALSFAADPYSDKPEAKVPNSDTVDFEKEHGKVYLKSRYIMNGVCVIWKGWVDCERLDGTGCLDFDPERAEIEIAMEREKIEKFRAHVDEFSTTHRLYGREHDLSQEAQAENMRRMRRNNGVKMEQTI